MMLGWIRMGAGAAVGAAAMFGVAAIYDATVDDPRIRKNTRTIVEAEAQRRTKEAINAVGDDAERARIMRRYCSERGELYDFVAGECRE